MTSSVIEGLLQEAKSASDSDSSINVAKRQFICEGEARSLFGEVRKRMVRIDEWRKDSSATDYDLFDERGNIVNSEPIAEGRFVRISLYGGGKYDWVRVIGIIDEPEEFVITVKPSFDPTQKPPDPSRVSHFFGPEATNNFCLQLNDKTDAFYIIGLNEKTNTEFAAGLIEASRNTAIANIGYYSGLQKAVWNEFCQKMLKFPEETAA